MAPFSRRLDKLNSTERQTVTGALKRVATVEALSEDQFSDLSNAILTAWERVRLRQLIEDVAGAEVMDEGILLGLLAEAQVLNALHIAEAIRAKLEILSGLRKRIEEHERENAVRDYIANNPWLLSPKWETFKRETSVRNLVESAAQDAGLHQDQNEESDRRIDLVLSSGRQLLVVEFMRPGLTVDRDHINRYQAYIDILRSRIAHNNVLGFREVSGLLVAVKLDRRPGMDETLRRLSNAELNALEWGGLACTCGISMGGVLGHSRITCSGR